MPVLWHLAPVVDSKKFVFKKGRTSSVAIEGLQGYIARYTWIEGGGGS